MAAQKKRNRQPWTAADDARLREMWGQELPIGDLVAAFRRSEFSIYGHAKHIGLGDRAVRTKPWTAAEIAALRDGIAAGRTHAQLAAEIGRPVRALGEKAYRLGLLLRPKVVDWSPADDDRLCELWGTVSTLGMISRMMKRRRETLVAHAERLGLPRRVASVGLRTLVGWPPARVARLRELWAQDISLDAMAVELHCRRPTLVKKAKRLGLPERARATPVFKVPRAGGSASGRKPGGETTLSREMQARILELWRAGGTTPQIVDRVGCSRGQVARLVRAHGLQRGPDAGGTRAKTGRIVSSKVVPLRTGATELAGTAPVGLARMEPALPPSALRVAPLPRQLKRRHAFQPCSCQWPFGHPGAAGFRFCGDTAMVENSAYCPTHHAMAYVPAGQKGEAA